MRNRAMAVVIGVVMVGLLASCSSSNSGASRSAATLTLPEATDWYGKATESVADCRAGAAALGAAIAAFAVQTVDQASSVPIVMAAGDAAEVCLRALDSPAQLAVWAELERILPNEALLLEKWVDATDEVARASTVAAAGNLYSRYFVSAVFELQRQADEIAAQFEQRVVEISNDLGIDPPTGEILYHWNAPEH